MGKDQPRVSSLEGSRHDNPRRRALHYARKIIPGQRSGYHIRSLPPTRCITTCISYLLCQRKDFVNLAVQTIAAVGISYLFGRQNFHFPGILFLFSVFFSLLVFHVVRSRVLVARLEPACVLCDRFKGRYKASCHIKFSVS